MTKTANRTGTMIVRMVAVAVLAGASSCTAAANNDDPHAAIVIPHGAPVLMDGKIGAGEWDDARKIESDSVMIYVKRDVRLLYVAVQPQDEVFSVDLYFDRGGEAPLLNLHASAKLGEREGFFGKWPDWVWWNNRSWAANVVRATSFEHREFLADEVKEYQIAIERIGVQRFWLSADLSNEDETLSVPGEGPVRHRRHWVELLLW